ncbi:MAG: IS200/IS605 family transposase [Armatimonadota bacterium]
MGRNYAATYYHIVWTTYKREPLMSSDDLRASMAHHIAVQFAKERCVVYEIGVVQDHVHSVVAIPPSERVSDVIGHVKGETTHSFKQNGIDIRWQSGYGVITFAQKDLHSVCEYAANQIEHHGDKGVWGTLELTSDTESS